MKHSSLLVTAALAIGLFGVFTLTQSSSAQTVDQYGVVCPAGMTCTRNAAAAAASVNCPIGFVCTPSAVGASGYAAGSYYNSVIGNALLNAGISGATVQPTITRLGNYKCDTASGVMYAADAAQCQDLKATNLGAGVQGTITTSYADSNPTVSVSSSTVTVTQYNANGTVKSTSNYLTTLPSNNGMTTNGGNVTYTAYRSCQGIAATSGSTCYQGNGSVTISNPGSVSSMPCNGNCIEGLPGQGVNSIRPMPSCSAAISFEAANRLASVVPAASSIIGPSTLHLAALAAMATSSVSQSVVPRTGTVFSANPNFDGSSLSPNVISQTRTTSKFVKAVFDICLDQGYVPNTPAGLNAASVVSLNTPVTQYVIFGTPQ